MDYKKNWHKKTGLIDTAPLQGLFDNTSTCQQSMCVEWFIFWSSLIIKPILGFLEIEFELRFYGPVNPLRSCQAGQFT